MTMTKLIQHFVQHVSVQFAMSILNYSTLESILNINLIIFNFLNIILSLVSKPRRRLFQGMVLVPLGLVGVMDSPSAGLEVSLLCHLHQTISVPNNENKCYSTGEKTTCD